MKLILGLLMMSVMAHAAAAKTQHAESTKSFDLGDSTSVTLVERAFDPAHARIETCGETHQICRINGGAPFGIDGDMPRTYLARLTLKVGRKTYDLDTRGMYDAWGDHPLEGKGTIRYMAASCSDTAFCTLRGIFSDGGGTYVAEWQIRYGISVRTILTDSNDIVNSFLEHLEPPVFD